MTNDNINFIGLECKHTLHIPTIPGVRDDYHMVKEIIHFKDGKKKPNIRMIKDFKRPFYITKPHYQNHKDKKEMEYLSKVNKYESTESNLANNIAIRLGMVGYSKNSMRDVRDSPFLYGTETSSSTILKKMYQLKWPDLHTENTMAALDIETDIEDDSKITIMTVSMPDKVFTVATLDYLKPLRKSKADIEKELWETWDYAVPDTELKRGVTEKTFKVAKNELDMIIMIFEEIHKWKPDFLAAHNVDYEITNIVKVIEREGLRPEDIFSDPDIPKELRTFKYYKGRKSRVTEKGVEFKFDPQDVWNIATVTASYHWIDTMSAYNYIRANQGKIPGGYGLDNLLKHNGITGKLFKDMSDKFLRNSADWHIDMSNNHKIKYMVYNQYDTFAMHELENKTKDIAISINVLAGSSDYRVFNSGPKRLVDNMHFYYLENDRVLGVKPKELDNDKVLGLDQWIVTLQTFRIRSIGLKLVKEYPELATNIRGMVTDLDAVSSYPSNIIAANVSKQTTRKEIISIKGKTKEVFMAPNLEIFAGPASAGNFVTTMLGFPEQRELLKRVKKKYIERQGKKE